MKQKRRRSEGFLGMTYNIKLLSHRNPCLPSATQQSFVGSCLCLAHSSTSMPVSARPVKPSVRGAVRAEIRREDQTTALPTTDKTNITARGNWNDCWILP
mmetsp:Transcript_24175/g.38398  ORF Transcript_24175/g.38398 Transcript_24175/m.38398 type:complete len:100 (+) Transcript_24175:186-485(+)